MTVYVVVKTTYSDGDITRVSASKVFSTSNEAYEYAEVQNEKYPYAEFSVTDCQFIK